ncbi:MAG: hypothetical protein MJB57_12375 [Gemmatimonadetes bacterium]|nr:hypothetical protein [Gemmatimonadota bacterium]
MGQLLSRRSSMGRAFFMALGAGLVCSVATPDRGIAQNAGSVLEAPAAAEAMAFGNAPNLRGRDANLLFYAPAFLRSASGASLGLQRFGGEGTLVGVAAVTSDDDGGIGVGVQYMRHDADAVVGPPDFQSAALTPGDIGVGQLVATLGFSLRRFGLENGVAFKYVEQSFDNASDRGLLFDVGVGRDLGPIAVALTARNLGSDLGIPTGATRTSLEMPTQLALGATTEQFEVGELDMFLTGQLMVRRDGEVVPAGGLEVSYWPVQGYTFRLRAGAQRVIEDERSPFAFGAAFTSDSITFEYAFQPFDGDGSGHRFGIRWR